VFCCLISAVLDLGLWSGELVEEVKLLLQGGAIAPLWTLCDGSSKLTSCVITLLSLTEAYLFSHIQIIIVVYG
jgi:hypothetical protein